MIQRYLPALMGALLLAAPAWAQTEASRDPSLVQPGTYTLDPNHTQVMFGASHLGFSTYFGRFSGVSGTLSIDPAKPETARLEVSVPVGSVSTTSEKLDGELRSGDWLESQKFPTMTFKSSKITRTGLESAKVEGDLTLHGVTKPITLAVQFHGGGTNPMDKKFTIGFDGFGHLQRSAFGVTKYLPLIGDDLEVIITAAFERQG